MKEKSQFYIRKFFFTSKLTLALVLLLVVARIALLPQRIEKTLASGSAPDGDESRINETVHPSDSLSTDYTKIAERNPFGTPNQTRDTDKLMSFDTATSEEMGLALSGTIAGNPEVARAIIKNLKTGTSDLYKTGQKVEDATIEYIGTDEIILSYNGRRKILKLNIAQPGNSTETSPAKTINETSNAGRADSSAPIIHTDTQTKTGCVEAILKHALIEPHVVDGRVEGFRITDLENIGHAQELGFKNGDIIRKVNGHLLTSRQKAHQIFKKAISQAALNLELLRDDETKKLSFNLR
jgi:type II secretion system protein C